jgi:hypothetical protein
MHDRDWTFSFLVRSASESPRQQAKTLLLELLLHAAVVPLVAERERVVLIVSRRWAGL